jgi:ABC-2 type transport system permease protein
MKRSIERTFELVRKEFRQLFRDRRMIAFMFGAPVLQLLLLGYAVSTDVRDTPMIVVDRDRTPESRALIDAFTASGRFVVVDRSERSVDLDRALDRGDTVVGLEIPIGFAKDLARGEGSVQLLFDGTNSNQATVAKSYAERIAVSFGVTRAGLTVKPPIELRSRAWFNPSLESRNYNVPGVTGVIVYFVCLVLTAMAVVREREIGTLEQLMVSPLQPYELIAGKSIPVAIIGLFDVAVVSLLAVFYFRIPFRGSVIHLLAASLLYLMSGLGFGLLISTISKTQQEAFMATILVFMPSLLLSGFMFPIRSMPRFFQIVTLANPVRHYMKVIRAIFLKGAAPSALWPEHVALLLIGTTIFAFAVSRFEKRLR